MNRPWCQSQANQSPKFVNEQVLGSDQLARCCQSKANRSPKFAGAQVLGSDQFAPFEKGGVS